MSCKRMGWTSKCIYHIKIKLNMKFKVWVTFSSWNITDICSFDYQLMGNVEDTHTHKMRVKSMEAIHNILKGLWHRQEDWFSYENYQMNEASSIGCSWKSPPSFLEPWHNQNTPTFPRQLIKWNIHTAAVTFPCGDEPCVHTLLPVNNINLNASKGS